jgi:hypothetical protein
MRLLTTTLLLAMVLLASAAVSRPAHAGPIELQRAAVDSHDDTRVEVQLVVVGVAAFSVVGVCGASYLLRRRLGLTKYDPKEHAAH